MWNHPTQAELDALPRLYATEGIKPQDKTIAMHFFLGGSDWWVAEAGAEGDDTILFGFACLNGDRDNAEWGYTSLGELAALKVAPGLDLYWRPRPAGEVAEIARCLARRG